MLSSSPRVFLEKRFQVLHHLGGIVLVQILLEGGPQVLPAVPDLLPQVAEQISRGFRQIRGVPRSVLRGQNRRCGQREQHAHKQDRRNGFFHRFSSV